MDAISSPPPHSISKVTTRMPTLRVAHHACLTGCGIPCKCSAGEARNQPPLSWLLLKIDLGERLPVAFADDEASVALLDGPGRREAAGGSKTKHLAVWAHRGSFRKLGHSFACPGNTLKNGSGRL
jgi:hypothetical protein